MKISVNFSLMNPSGAITVSNIHKSFKTTRALQGVSLNVPEGTIFGLLGPNGAGKTTLVRILTTLLKPSEGRATVNGLDVVKNSKQVRYQIGLAGQYAAVDESLTGFENLYLFGRLYHLDESSSIKRAHELLEQFQLSDASDRLVKTYSGGMRRRLDLAGSLVNRSKILFLDEPTTGLDPQSRIALWDIIKNLVKEGTTVLLTTQYLEEADQLADRIAVINHGQVIAEDTPDNLKQQIGGEVIELHVNDKSRISEAAKIIERFGSEPSRIDEALNQVTLPTKEGSKILASVIRSLDEAKIEIADIVVRKPTLDEVFLKLTGHGMQL